MRGRKKAIKKIRGVNLGSRKPHTSYHLAYACATCNASGFAQRFLDVRGVHRGELISYWGVNTILRNY